MSGHYKRLPNDTDFTIFKEHGIEGYNFAFVRYVQNYHTKNDDFAHADPGSLQHHGQNTWQLLTALADFDLGSRTAGKAIYTDVPEHLHPIARYSVWAHLRKLAGEGAVASADIGDIAAPWWGRDSEPPTRG